MDSIRKGRKRNNQEKSDAPTKVLGHSIVTLGKAVSSQCLTQFRSLYSLSSVLEIDPFQSLL